MLTAFEGTLATEPIIRYDREGEPTTTLQVLRDDTVTEVACFGRLAENVALTLTKGTEIVVIGHGSYDGPPVFIADAVGVSLANATAEISKNEEFDS